MRYDEARQWYLKGLECGASSAAIALQALELKSGHPVESYAWGQLSLVHNDPEGKQDTEDLKRSPEYLMLVEAAGMMEEAQLAEAERLSEERIARWRDVVSGADLAAGATLTRSARKRTPPRYPMHLARSNRAGFAAVYMEYDAEGRVRDAIAYAYSHPDFGKSAVQAIKRWRFEPDPEDPDGGSAVQRIDFMLDHD